MVDSGCNEGRRLPRALTEEGGAGRGKHGGGYRALVGLLLFLPLLAACGGPPATPARTTTPATTPALTSTGAEAAATSATVTTTANAALTSAAPAPSTALAPQPTPAPTVAPTAAAGGALRPIPVAQALSGQDRVGAPGLGAFLFFDSDG